MVEQFAAVHGEPLTVVEYLQAPLSAAQLAELRTLLGADAHAMVRDNETEYAQLNLAAATGDELLAAIAGHPRLLQRPIVTYRGRAMIGRPPERLAALLQTASAS